MESWNRWAAALSDLSIYCIKYTYRFSKSFMHINEVNQVVFTIVFFMCMLPGAHAIILSFVLSRNPITFASDYADGNLNYLRLWE